MYLHFDDAVVLVGSDSQFIVVDPGETWDKEELFETFLDVPDSIEVIQIGSVTSNAERVEKVNKIIDNVQEKGLSYYLNTYSIPRIVH